MKEEWGDLGQLRVAAEGLADAIDTRVRVHNRIRSGSADGPVLLKSGELILPGQELTEAQIKKHPIGWAVQRFENDMRETLQDQYQQAVPAYVREWAGSVPILKSGELFPRIVALTGNPVEAIPLKMEGTGKERTAVPDGEPYQRSLRQFWQWCGRGDPDHVVNKGDQASLLRGGKIRTVTPLLYTFTGMLVKGAARSLDISQSVYYKHYLVALDDARGHGGKCHAKGTWPYECAGTHKRHNKLCKNKHVPPLSPNGCGIGVHPEWGEPGTPWRPGHIQAHAYRIVEKELLRDFWALVKNH